MNETKTTEAPAAAVTTFEAKAWAAADPYVTEGVFESYEVRPFMKVLP